MVISIDVDLISRPESGFQNACVSRPQKQKVDLLHTCKISAVIASRNGSYFINLSRVDLVHVNCFQREIRERHFNVVCEVVIKNVKF